MAGSKSDAYEADLLKAATGQATTMLTTTALATVPCNLYTTAPTESTAGTLVSGGSYAAVDSKGKWGTPTGTSPTQVANNAVITFPTATADWGTIVGFSISAGAGGETYYGTLTTSKAVLNGDTPSFAVGALVITED
jgi:hypothetical protein